ncbi:MAG: FecR domain-containing protein [Armatimonadetes bacterium]|nr:FecR domain-containing protein [Armatimonadota bacterium]
MNYFKRIILISLFFTFLLFNYVFAVESEWKLVVKVTGNVESQKSNETDWKAIWQSRMLKDGDKARTMEESRAKIRLADQSVLTIGSNTIVEMSKFKITPQSRIAQFKLWAGKIRLKVEEFLGKDSKVEVTTPNAVLAARGTDFFVEQEKVSKQGLGGNTVVIVFDGVVSAQIGAQAVEIPAGQMGTIGAYGVFVAPMPTANVQAVIAQAQSAAGETQGEAPAGGDADLQNPSISQVESIFGTSNIGAITQIITGEATQAVSAPTTTVIYSPSASGTGSVPIVIH